jgi:hypothetical protein
MKKIGNFFLTHLLAGFYALAIVLTLLCCLAAAAWDGLGYATGRIRTESFPLDTLTVQDIIQTDSGLWVSSGSDPQILLSADQKIRSVTWNTAQTAVITEAEGYYAKNGADFSLRQRVWAKNAAGGGAEIDFPLSGGNTVRIDPVGAAGTILAQSGDEAVLTINAPRSFWSYFSLRAEQAIALLLLPAVAAAIADWVRSVVQGRRAGSARGGSRNKGAET